MPDVDLYIKIQFIHKITLSNIYLHCKRCAKIPECPVLVSIQSVNR